jgi:hypothetical protein
MGDGMVRFAALMEVEREVRRLAADPGLGARPTGPFESRPVYKCTLEANEKRVTARFVYSVADGFLDVLLFSTTPT